MVLGQATIALELLEKLPQVGRVVIPVGGGGLIAGMGFALKTLNPTIEVLGVQSVATPAMYNYLYGENLPQGDTLADGLAGDIEAGSITFDLCRQYADSVAVVEESAIAEAIRWVFYQHGWVIEGSAAVSVAAWQTQAIPHDAIPTVLLITGGNIDAAKFRHLLED